MTVRLRVQAMASQTHPSCHPGNRSPSHGNNNREDLLSVSRQREELLNNLCRLTCSSVRSNLLRVPALHCSGISLCRHVGQHTVNIKGVLTSSTVMIEQSRFMQTTFSSQKGHSLYRSTYFVIVVNSARAKELADIPEST